MKNHVWLIEQKAKHDKRFFTNCYDIYLTRKDAKERIKTLLDQLPAGTYFRAIKYTANQHRTDA